MQSGQLYLHPVQMMHKEVSFNSTFHNVIVFISDESRKFTHVCTAVAICFRKRVSSWCPDKVKIFCGFQNGTYNFLISE